MSSSTHLERGGMVSVVLPTRNRSDRLATAVESVLRQSWRDLELIIVNDGSVDSTENVVARFAAEDQRVIGLRNNLAVGAAAARNQAIRRSAGEYVAFIDDDSEWRPTKLERQLAEFAISSPEVGVVYSPYLHVEEGCRERLIGSAAAIGQSPRRVLLQRNFIGTPAVIARREVLLAVEGFDERLPRLQDWDLWVRLAEVTRFAYVEEPLVRCHYVPGGISTQSDALVSACNILIAKLADRPDTTRSELGAWHRALGHALMIGGAPGEGRRVLRQSIAYQPWSPLGLLMATLAALGPPFYLTAERARGRALLLLKRLPPDG